MRTKEGGPSERWCAEDGAEEERRATERRAEVRKRDEKWWRGSTHPPGDSGADTKPSCTTAIPRVPGWGGGAFRGDTVEDMVRAISDPVELGCLARLYRAEVGPLERAAEERAPQTG